MSVNIPLNRHPIGFPYLKGKMESQVSQNRNERPYSEPGYKPLYELSNACLSNGYIVIYGIEPIPNESARQGIFKNIEDANDTQQIKDSFSSGLLTVIDTDSIYRENGVNYKSIVDFWNFQVKEAQQRCKVKTKATIIFCAPDSYLKNYNYDTFMLFEDSVAASLYPNTSIICWYLGEWLDNITLASLVRILNIHKYTIHTDWKYKEWTAGEIINIVSHAIDEKLGQGSATLFFQTLQIIHKVTPNAIVSRPILLEAFLKRLLDYDFADSIMDSIFEKIMERALFKI